MKKVLLGLVCALLIGQVANGEVLLLKNNYYIDEVTVLSRWKNMIIFDYQSTLYQINERTIIKVSDTIPEGWTLLEPNNIETYEEEVKPVAQVTDSQDSLNVDQVINSPNVDPVQPVDLNANAVTLQDVIILDPEEDLPVSASEQAQPTLLKPVNIPYQEEVTVKTKQQYTNSAKLIIGGQLGINFYDMNELNRFIDNNNAVLDSYDIPLLNTINSDFGIDGTLGIRFNHVVEFGWQISYLNAVSQNSHSNQYNHKIDIPAVESMAYLKFLVPLSQRVYIGIGIAMGGIYVNGQEEIKYYTGTRVTRRRYVIEGENLSMKFMTSVDIDLSTYVGLTFLVGYRNANVSELNLDYSGLQLKTGIYFMLGK